MDRLSVGLVLIMLHELKKEAFNLSHSTLLIRKVVEVLGDFHRALEKSRSVM